MSNKTETLVDKLKIAASLLPEQGLAFIKDMSSEANLRTVTKRNIRGVPTRVNYYEGNDKKIVLRVVLLGGLYRVYTPGGEITYDFKILD